MPNTRNVKSNEEKRREHRTARQRQQKMRRRIFYITLCLCVVIIGVILSLTVFFKISSFSVTGNSIYSNEEIIAASNIKIGDNLFLLKYDKIKNNICSKLPFVGEVSFSKSLPDKLNMTVSPTSIKCAIEYDGGYVLIDESGKVLGKVADLKEVYESAGTVEQIKKTSNKTDEPTTVCKETTSKTSSESTKATTKNKESTTTESTTLKPTTAESTSKSPSENTTNVTTKLEKTQQPKYVLGTKKITIVKGINIKSAVIGQKLEVSNEKSFGLYKNIMNQFEKNKITGITMADFTDSTSIVLMYQDRIKIVLGSASNLDDKMALAQKVLQNQDEISPCQKGTIDLSIDKKAYFSPEQETKAPEENTSEVTTVEDTSKTSQTFAENTN